MNFIIIILIQRSEDAIVVSIKERNKHWQVLENPIWDRVGQTPLIPLKHLLPDRKANLNLYGKAEWYNPGGSVKDRPAAKILLSALRTGQLDEGKIFLDSSSGNMGIAYATIGSALGIPVHLIIPENAGPERLGLLRAFGVQLTLSDPLEGSDGAREVAAEMAESQSDLYYYADQYSNPANWQAHYEGTGPEIWNQTQAKITHFVAGMGTTGTITGTGRYLKEKNPNIQIVAVQPDGPLHGLEGLKHLNSSPIPSIYDETIPDQIMEISTEETYQTLRHLARNHGLFLGISAGAAIIAAQRLAENLDEGTIAVIMPDNGLKYLSLPFWGDR